MASPSVSVIIVTYNSADCIQQCLASLPAAMADLTFEVVVVDNGSTDGTADLVEQLPNPPVLVRSSNVGYAAGINAGVAVTRGECFLILNPDTECEPGAVPRSLLHCTNPAPVWQCPSCSTSTGRGRRQ